MSEGAHATKKLIVSRKWSSSRTEKQRPSAIYSKSYTGVTETSLRSLTCSQSLS
jgi:hypothetical protein